MKKFFALLLCSIIACEDGGPLSPTETLVENEINEEVIGAGPSIPNSTCFDSLGITRRDINHRIVGATLFLFVPATNADYVNVWTPNVNDTLLGHGPANQEFSVNLPGPGEYKITLAIERREGNGVCQYDGHHFTVTATIPRPPPNTPPTTPPSDPPVDVCPNIEGNQEEIPEGLVFDEVGNCVEPSGEEDPGLCYYEVAGNDKEVDCLAVGGVFSTHDGSDHCIFPLPGVALDGFNLAPGLSHEDCLRKQDQ